MSNHNNRHAPRVQDPPKPENKPEEKPAEKQAEKPAEKPADPPAPPAGPVDGADDGDKGGPPKKPVQGPLKYPMEVAAGKSVTCNRGLLKAGVEVRKRDFDKETLDLLVRKKIVLVAEEKKTEDK